MKSKIVFWVVAVLATLGMFQDKRWKYLEVFDSDPGGYYSYLPATFLYGDPARPDSLNRIRAQYRPEAGDNDIGLKVLPNGRTITRYTLGKALVDAPWFAGAHWWARRSDRYAPDGFSRPYQQSLMLAGLFHGLLGLWVLRRLLRLYYTDAVTAWAVAGIGLGTNALYYIAYEASMAHAVLLLWQAALLYCTARWYHTGRWSWALGLGGFAGLVILTRPSDAMFLLIPLLWGLQPTLPALRARMMWWWQRAPQLAAAVALGLVVLSPQAFFWHHVGGQWLLYSYQNEGFDFGHPHLWDGLVSFRKGWWLYTPLALVSLAGLRWLRRDVPAAWLPVLVLVPVAIYITFSWGNWSYGGSFGCRPLVSLYPLLALPLASLVAHAPWGRALRGLLVGLIVLNCWQTWQYAAGVIHWDEMTAERYFTNFFRARL